MSMNQDMVIMDGVSKEVLRYFGCRFDPHLRAAEIGFKLTAFQLDIDGQQTFHVAAQFNQRVVTGRQVAVDRHAYTRFEMRRVLMLLSHA